jgi:exosortase C (VPDSG-CTERM-specific)
MVGVGLVFAPTLFDWIRLGIAEDLHSHVLLVPFIVGYLIRLGERDAADAAPGEPSLGLAIAMGSAAVLTMALSALGSVSAGWAPVDLIALRIVALALSVLALASVWQGKAFVKRHAFAFSFMLFAIPLPTFAENGLEVALQHASAEVAFWGFQLTGTTVLREGRFFELPGLSIEVAQQCSGIRSSYVLFMVSLLAGHLLLRRLSHRVVLTLLVFPLGIVRNAFRIVTLALLTLHVDPAVLEGPLHHRGGPIFFAASLVPLLVLLWWMRRVERRAGSSHQSA